MTYVLEFRSDLDHGGGDFRRWRLGGEMVSSDQAN
jgi:hypothetical protein